MSRMDADKRITVGIGIAIGIGVVSLLSLAGRHLATNVIAARFRAPRIALREFSRHTSRRDTSTPALSNQPGPQNGLIP
jgi:hypothetical protein